MATKWEALYQEHPPSPRVGKEGKANRDRSRACSNSNFHMNDDTEYARNLSKQQGTMGRFLDRDSVLASGYKSHRGSRKACSEEARARQVGCMGGVIGTQAQYLNPPTRDPRSAKPAPRGLRGEGAKQNSNKSKGDIMKMLLEEDKSTKANRMLDGGRVISTCSTYEADPNTGSPMKRLLCNYGAKVDYKAPARVTLYGKDNAEKGRGGLNIFGGTGTGDSPQYRPSTAPANSKAYAARNKTQWC